jgi:two-component system chemotaxis response regulator CheY
MPKQVRTGLEDLSVLVIDDHKGMRDIISTVLSGLGVGKVTTVPGPGAARSEMQQSPPDIILLDRMLDGQDGLRFVRYIRALPDSQNPFVPIILVTGHGEYARVVQARDAGVTEFLVKPLTTLAVAQRLEAVIHHPRPFVRCRTYIGPDRRRQDCPFDGADRRNRAAAAPDQPQVDRVTEESRDDR